MEFLHGSMVIATLGGAMIVIAVSIVIFYFLIQSLWPSVIGAAATYAAWMYVDHFIAVICALMFIVFQLWWLSHTKEKNPINGYIPENEKSKQRTQDLYLPGYFD